jgi:hypothetical protein
MIEASAQTERTNCECAVLKDAVGHLAEEAKRLLVGQVVFLLLMRIRVRVIAAIRA